MLSRGVLDRRADLVLAGRPLGDEFEIDHRNVRRRHADGRAVKLAFELRQDEADRGERDDVLSTDERARLRELERENRVLRQEREMA